MSDLRLIVDQKKHGGWKRISVSRSIESVAGSFAVEISDKWLGQPQAWPIAEEDPVRIELDGDVVLDGFVDSRNAQLVARSLSYTGRDRSGALVDCSAVLARWSYANASVVDLATKVCAPFGISVSVQGGVKMQKAPAKTAISPGDTAWSVIEGAAKIQGVLVVSDGAGGILITGPGTGRAAALIEGENVKDATGDYNAMDRFRRYIVLTQVAVADENWNSKTVTRVKGEAVDLGVRRANRVKIIRPEKGLSIPEARRRADWEARLAAARADSVSVVVQGWRQSPGGRLWPINALVDAQIPTIGVKGTMLITKVDFSSDEGGEVATLSLVRPDAFSAEPTKATVAKTGAWKELARGATVERFGV